MLCPEKLSSQALSAWLHWEKSVSQITQKVDLKGFRRIPAFLAEILEEINDLPSVLNN